MILDCLGEVLFEGFLLKKQSQYTWTCLVESWYELHAYVTKNTCFLLACMIGQHPFHFDDLSFRPSIFWQLRFAVQSQSLATTGRHGMTGEIAGLQSFVIFHFQDFWYRGVALVLPDVTCRGNLCMLVLCRFCLLQYLRHISFQRHSFSNSLWICIKCLICFLLSLLKWCGPGVSPCFHQGFSCSSWFLHSFCRLEASIACSLCWPQVSPLCIRHVQQVTILQSTEAKDCSRHDCWGRSQCRCERRTVSLFWNMHKISSDNVCALPRLEGMWLSKCVRSSQCLCILFVVPLEGYWVLKNIVKNYEATKRCG